PIQVNHAVRGIEHEKSREVAYEVRSLGVDLFNQHNLLDESKRVIALLKSYFGYLPEFSEKVQEDVHALQNIVQQRNEAQSQSEQWAREIFYEVEIGLVFKNILRISSKGIEWKGETYPLDDVTHCRWG